MIFSLLSLHERDEDAGEKRIFLGARAGKAEMSARADVVGIFHPVKAAKRAKVETHR